MVFELVGFGILERDEVVAPVEEDLVERETFLIEAISLLLFEHQALVRFFV